MLLVGRQVSTWSSEGAWWFCIKFGDIQFSNYHFFTVKVWTHINIFFNRFVTYLYIAPMDIDSKSNVHLGESPKTLFGHWDWKQLSCHQLKKTVLSYSPKKRILMIKLSPLYLNFLVLNAGNLREWSIITNNNHSSNPHSHPFPTFSTSKWIYPEHILGMIGQRTNFWVSSWLRSPHHRWTCCRSPAIVSADAPNCTCTDQKHRVTGVPEFFQWEYDGYYPWANIYIYYILYNIL